MLEKRNFQEKDGMKDGSEGRAAGGSEKSEKDQQL
jgi:hypothetical protein